MTIPLEISQIFKLWCDLSSISRLPGPPSTGSGEVEDSGSGPSSSGLRLAAWPPRPPLGPGLTHNNKLIINFGPEPSSASPNFEIIINKQ